MRLSAQSRGFRGITATLLFHVPLTEQTSRVRTGYAYTKLIEVTITPVQASLILPREPSEKPKTAGLRAPHPRHLPKLIEKTRRR